MSRKIKITTSQLCKLAPIKMGSIQNDTEKIEKIVDDSITYETYEEYAPYSDKDYAYVKIYDDSTFRVSQSKFTNYYDEKYETNLEQFRDVKYLLRRGNYTVDTKLTNIVEENAIEESMKVTMAEWANIMEDADYTVGDSATLEAIAYTDCWRGGDAVFQARAILGLEVDDQPNGLRIGRNDDMEVSVKLFPNPAMDKIFLSEQFKEISMEIPDHVDPLFRFMLTPHSGEVDPTRRSLN